MSIWWMDKRMAERFDPWFPESGGLEHLAEVRERMLAKLPKQSENVGETFFHPIEIVHIRKALRLLEGDEEAKATIMNKIAFAQMKNDCAG